MSQRLERAHGGALVTTAVCVPLGEGVTAVALGGVALMLLLRRHAVQPQVLLHGTVGRVLAGFVVWLAAGLAAVLLGGEGWLKPGEIGRWVPLLAVPLTLLSMTALPRVWLQRAAGGFVASLSVAALFGLLQYGLDWQPEFFWHTHSGARAQAWVPGEMRAVAGGFYFHRLKMAHVLLVGLSILLGRQMFGVMPWSRRLAEAGLGVLLTTTLFLTFTRGAFLGLAAAIAGCLLLASWRARLLAMVLALGVMGGLGSMPQVRARLQSMGAAEASEVRAFLWGEGVRVIIDHPFGVGLGNYSQVIGRYYDAVDPTFGTRTYPHNVLLAAWAETGPVGLAGYVWAWAAFAAACVQRLRRGEMSPDRGGRSAAAAGLAGAVTFWTVGMTHDVLYHNAVGYAFCGLMALCLAFLFTRPRSDALPLDTGSA